jgi:hypothetical protein
MFARAPYDMRKHEFIVNRKFTIFLVPKLVNFISHMVDKISGLSRPSIPAFLLG